MKRHASVLVFKEGTDPKMIEFALAQLIPILDDSYWLADGTSNEDGTWKSGESVPFRIEEYESDHGGPVFYLP
jgi:hypothetical protein